ncbi:hypothetical protein PENSPDRAFT_754958 [Peniophora sp. CONT]|nr:hypothetical protein PENSPDRAFT_754958 [Peniophora sp. CONT]
MLSSHGSDKSTRTRQVKDAWTSFVQSRLDTGGQIRAAPGGHDRVARLQAADIELEVADTVIALAKQQRNALNAACSLPSELLVEIFKDAQEDWLPERTRTSCSAQPRKFLYDLGWAYITQVCAAWRQAAHSNARLWTKLMCLDVPPALAATTLQNSCQMLLDIEINHPFPLSEGCGTVVDSVVERWLSAPVLHRTQKLSIKANIDAVESWVTELQHPAPALYQLGIALAGGAYDDYFMLPPSLFAGHFAPSLKNLILLNCFPTWHEPFLSTNLTQLRLGSNDFEDSEDMSYLPTISQLRSLLSSLVQLQELTFLNVTPIDDPEPVQPWTFPSCLKELEFICSSVDILDIYGGFWRHFKTSSRTIVTFDILLGESDELLEDGVVNGLQSVWDHEPAHPFRELHLSSHTISLRHSVSASRADWTRRWPSQEPDPHSYGVITEAVESTCDRVYGSRHIQIWQQFPNIFGLLPLDTLHALSFHSDMMRAFDASDWLEHFSSSTDVERLVIPYLDSDELLVAMNNLRDSDGQLALFPRLQTVVVHRGEVEDSHNVTLNGVMINFIDMRREKGAPIHELLVSREMMGWDVWSRAGEGTNLMFFD